MHTFAAVDDAFLTSQIEQARGRIVYVAPGVGIGSAVALVEAMSRDEISLTIILDSDEDAYRIGYGEATALEVLHEAAAQQSFPLRRQPGLRVGLLVVDDNLVIWAPTALSVERAPSGERPNGVLLTGKAVTDIEAAVGADHSNVLPDQADIGRDPMTPDELAKTIAALNANPPAPYDLAQRTRIFSTRFQFVEFEIRGAEWTQRRIKLSSLLLNADLPESLQDLLETQVRPFQAMGDLKFRVPLIVDGRPAFEEDGSRMCVPASQAEVAKSWTAIRDEYLHHLKGFGWLIRRNRLEAFYHDVRAYEETLAAWVAAFRKHVSEDEQQIVDAITSTITARLERSDRKAQFQEIDLRAEVEKGLDRLRVIEPGVRIVLKNVSWESSRDTEFLEAFEKALPEKERAGWFQEFDAVKSARISWSRSVVQHRPVRKGGGADDTDLFRQPRGK